MNWSPRHTSYHLLHNIQLHILPRQPHLLWNLWKVYPQRSLCFDRNMYLHCMHSTRKYHRSFGMSQFGLSRCHQLCIQRCTPHLMFDRSLSYQSDLKSHDLSLQQKLIRTYLRHKRSKCWTFRLFGTLLSVPVESFGQNFSFTTTTTLLFEWSNSYVHVEIRSSVHRSGIITQHIHRRWIRTILTILKRTCRTIQCFCKCDCDQKTDHDFETHHNLLIFLFDFDIFRKLFKSLLFETDTVML